VWRALISGSRLVAMGRRLRSRPPGRGVGDEAVALAADLLAMAVAAGLTPYLALELGARTAPDPVAARLAAVVEATEGGLRLAEALDAATLDAGTLDVGAPTSPALRRLFALLASSERSGSPAEEPLRRLATSLRADVRRRAMARARTIPVRLLFPLVLLVLPAFLLLTVAPVVLASVHG
jgi:Flp pilus assembly protein TadB